MARALNSSHWLFAAYPQRRSSSAFGRIADSKVRRRVHINYCVTENVVRFDLLIESLNVGRDGRADVLPLEPG
jgi:hypothetical protein